MKRDTTVTNGTNRIFKQREVNASFTQNSIAFNSNKHNKIAILVDKGIGNLKQKMALYCVNLIDDEVLPHYVFL